MAAYSLQGSLQGKRNEPQLDAKVEAIGLRYQEDSIGHLEAEIHACCKVMANFPVP